LFSILRSSSSHPKKHECASPYSTKSLLAAAHRAADRATLTESLGTPLRFATRQRSSKSVLFECCRHGAESAFVGDTTGEVKKNCDFFYYLNAFRCKRRALLFTRTSSWCKWRWQRRRRHEQPDTSIARDFVSLSAVTGTAHFSHHVRLMCCPATCTSSTTAQPQHTGAARLRLNHFQTHKNATPQNAARRKT
jgi:hypothetical protein